MDFYVCNIKHERGRWDGWLHRSSHQIHIALVHVMCMQIDEAPIGAVHLCEDVDADCDDAVDDYN